MKPKWRKADISLNDPAEQAPLPIIHDGAIATQGIGDGRLFPLVIIDTSSRPDITDMLKTHKHVGSGDVTTQWGKNPKKKNAIWLILSIIRPSRCNLLLEFDLSKYSSFVDQIVQSQGLYIQSGQNGDTLSSTLDKDRILAEIPSREFSVDWEQIYSHETEKFFRKMGLSKRAAKEKCATFIRTMREASKIRMGRHESEENARGTLIIRPKNSS